MSIAKQKSDEAVKNLQIDDKQKQLFASHKTTSLDQSSSFTYQELRE